MNKRTDINFDKHELLIVDNEHVTIHHLKIPGSSTNNIQFINCGGIMAVTGDYGNWIFCREFIPSSSERADEQYMNGKLKIASTQESQDYCSEKTENEIEQMILSGDHDGEELKFLKELQEYVGGNGEEYKAWAYENRPSDWDYLPYRTTTKYWLQAVYDGFDEVCNRLKIK